MGTKPDIATDSAASLLRLLGYEALRIPESPAKRCDLRADHVSGQLWIECKRDRLPEADEERFASVGFASQREPLTTRRKTMEHISLAMKQLRSTSPPGSLRLIWFDVTRPGFFGAAAAIHCTLYGIRWFKIMSGPPGIDVNFVPVYLGGKSAFQHAPDLAAAVIKTPGRIGLHLNPFSESLAGLARTRLFEILRQCGGNFDLDAVMPIPGAFAISRAVSGCGVAAVKDYLFEQYLITTEPGKDAASEFWFTSDREQGSHPTVPGAGTAALDVNVAAASAYSRTEHPVPG